MANSDTKYTEKNINSMKARFFSKNFSPSWYRKHFLGMMNHIEEVNKKESKNGNAMETGARPK